MLSPSLDSLRISSSFGRSQKRCPEEEIPFKSLCLSSQGMPGDFLRRLPDKHGFLTKNFLEEGGLAKLPPEEDFV